MGARWLRKVRANRAIEDFREELDDGEWRNDKT